MSRVVPSKRSLLNKLLSNPIALLVYGILTALYAAAFSLSVQWQVFAIVVTGIAFLGVAYLFATFQQSEAYLQSFPGQIRFSRILLRISAEADGSGTISYYFEGDNLATTPRRKLTFEVKYSSMEPLPSLVEGHLDGQPVTWKAVTSITEQLAAGEKQFHTIVTFDFGDLCGPRSRLPNHDFSVRIDGIFEKAFASSYGWYHTTNVLTDELVIELKAIDCRIVEAWESVSDFWNELDNVEIQRIRTSSYLRKVNDHFARWVVTRPIPTDAYSIKFQLEKPITPATADDAKSLQ